MRIPTFLARFKGFRFPHEIVSYAVWAYPWLGLGLFERHTFPPTQNPLKLSADRAGTPRQQPADRPTAEAVEVMMLDRYPIIQCKLAVLSHR
jgi:hypothetical protein